MRQGTAWPILFLVFLVVASGCTGPQQNPDTPNPQTPQPTPTPAAGSLEDALVGTWRNYTDTKSTRMLELRADKTWSFGSSNGSWHVEPIQPGDWEPWGMAPEILAPYYPTQKIVVEGWNRGTASGPIEEGDLGIDFFFVVYQVGPPIVSRPALAQLKFGRFS